ncbi:hypothetical protein GQ457_10G009310 [Hibiscus cannabinus]
MDYLLSMKEMFEQLIASLKKENSATTSIPTPPRAPIGKLAQHRSTTITGTNESHPEVTKYWLEATTRILTKKLHCSNENKLECAIALLADEALSWWETTTLIAPAEKVTWEFFIEEFKKKFISEQYLDERRKKFLYLRQGSKPIGQYVSEFCKHCKYGSEYIKTEKQKCQKFVDGLNEDLCPIFTALRIEYFQELVNRSTATEAKMKAPEKKKGESHGSEKRTRTESRSKQKFKRQKQLRESHANYSGVQRTNFIPRPQASSRTVTPGASTFSTGNTGQAPGCGICRKNHYGQCKSQNNACYLCGEADHYIKDFPRNPNKVSTRDPTTVSNAPSNKNRGPQRAESCNQSRGKGRGPQPATTAKLIELGLEHENATTSLLVSNPLGRTVPIKSVCNQCPIIIRGISFPINLYVIPSCEFDVILELDWLGKHEAWIDFQNRRLYLEGLGKESILLIDKKPTSIFALMTMQDEYDFGLSNIHVISEYMDVFPEELPRLPPIREVEFRIQI